MAGVLHIFFIDVPSNPGMRPVVTNPRVLSSCALTLALAALPLVAEGGGSAGWPGAIVSDLFPFVTRVAAARLRRPAAGRGGLVCAHCGFASAHDRAFYCPKCGMRLLRG